jgi:sulfhydrogenase subunit beta (sulfur reductase)
MVVLEHQGLDQILRALQSRGYALRGPTVRDGAIVLDTIQSADDLPKGWSDTHAPATYSINHSGDVTLFSYVVGPHSWKKFLFPSRLKLFSVVREGRGFSVASPEPPADTKQAFIGVRSCELHAIAIQDKVFAGGEYADSTYSVLREGTFILAVNCLHAGATCFCASMNTGPRVSSGFDIALTEILDDGRHYFVGETGSDKGKEILAKVDHREAGEDELQTMESLLACVPDMLQRHVKCDGLQHLLSESHEHPNWDVVAKRCLACANCTMVCPTCFCSTVEDVTDLTGDHAERWRRWDSCFTAEFAKVAGGNFRPSVRSRYRQWLTHKFGTWVDQFGTFGCVGCGRCITWCPVGIDVTEELKLFDSEHSLDHSSAS